MVAAYEWSNGCNSSVSTVPSHENLLLFEIKSSNNVEPNWCILFFVWFLSAKMCQDKRYNRNVIIR